MNIDLARRALKILEDAGNRPVESLAPRSNRSVTPRQAIAALNTYHISYVTPVEREDDADASLWMFGSSPSAEDVALGKTDTLTDRLYDAFSALTDLQRQTVSMYYGVASESLTERPTDTLTTVDIGSKLGCSAENVRQHLKRGLGRLREQLC